ncbi:MAG: hypothetical protein NDI67_15085 [Sulfuritalea sp.]|nr:hypothetical protein [Sulfuritalea sp.]
MKDLLDWVEKAGAENIKFRLQNAETLAKDASTTLTILLAGIGGSLAYAVKGFENPQIMPLTFGAAALSVWLTLAAVVLMVQCIVTTALPAPTNEPKNLFQKDYALEKLREVELANLQDRIFQITARNHRVAAWLDRVRLLAIASPLVFAIAALA